MSAVFFTRKALEVELSVRFTVDALCAGSSVPVLVRTFHDCMLSFGSRLTLLINPVLSL